MLHCYGIHNGLPVKECCHILWLYFLVALLIRHICLLKGLRNELSQGRADLFNLLDKVLGFTRNELCRSLQFALNLLGLSISVSIVPFRRQAVEGAYQCICIQLAVLNLALQPSLSSVGRQAGLLCNILKLLYKRVDVGRGSYGM